jgi:peptidoglycan/LPS O-acetylase OafA/YrhL
MSGTSRTIPTLNGIRAVSVLIVIVAHGGYGWLIPGGLGVTVFFFLSGYLITTLLLDEYEKSGTIDVKEFYLRRFSRLFPPLLLTLAIAYSLAAAGLLSGSISLGGFLAQVFYLANYSAIFFETEFPIPTGTIILWSLAVEEHFYIFYPMILLFLLSRGLSRRTIGLFFSIICAIVMIWRFYLVAQPDFVEARTYFATDTRIDSIVFGALLALWSNPCDGIDNSSRMSLRHWIWMLLSGGIFAFTLLYRDAAFRETYRYTLQGIALYPVFYVAIRYHGERLFRPLNSIILTRIGVWSYSIYLIHFVIIDLISVLWPSLQERPLLIVFFGTAVAMCYAAAIDQWIDPYFRRHRRSGLTITSPSATAANLS